MPPTRPSAPLGTAHRPAADGGFWDAFLPRVLANGLAMVGIAAAVLWIVQRDDAAEQRRFDLLHREVRELRQERDRLAALTDVLAQQAHEANLAVDVVRAQLRDTEAALAQARAPRRPAVEAVAPAPTLPLPEALAPIAIERLPEAGPAELAASQKVAGVELADFDPQIPRLRPDQRALTRAVATTGWHELMDEAAAGECGGLLGINPRCEEEVRRRLWIYGPAAITCMTSGNAVPDYVDEIRLENLPSHSVPLKHGAIILCDGALANP